MNLAAGRMNLAAGRMNLAAGFLMERRFEPSHCLNPLAPIADFATN
jgi:hypothetical protein